MENIDFLPERVRLQRQRRSRIMRLGALVAICAGMLALLAVTRQAGVRQAAANVAFMSDHLTSVQRQLHVLDDLQVQQAELLVKKTIDAQLGSRVDALDVLAELGRLMPAGITVRNLELQAVTAQAPVAPAGGRNISGRPTAAAGRIGERSVNRMRLDLTGLAPTDVDVAEFIGQLSTSPLFEDVNMGYTKNTRLGDRNAREFRVSCYVVR